MGLLLDALADNFVHEVQATPRTFDGHGRATPGVPFTVTCYVYGSVEKVQNRAGQMVDSRYAMLTNGHYGLTLNHVFTLPPEFLIVSGEPTSVEPLLDGEDDYERVMF